MRQLPVEQLVRIVSPLLRTRGSGRWLGLGLLLAIVAIAWWWPGPTWQSPSHPGGISTSRPLDNPAPSDEGRASSAANEALTPRQTAAPRAADSLRDVGRGVYRSPAGLVYTRGSEHGHRLQHVLAHGQDAPDRPGQHGVFATGSREAIVALIDEAYTLAERNEATRREQDQERTILTVDMRRVIGYIGGQVGNRRGRPPAHHLRLVLEGDRLITAYPVIP